jgi:hypothetical protein
MCWQRRSPNGLPKVASEGGIFYDHPTATIKCAWLDPFNENVWNYNIALSEEAALPMDLTKLTSTISAFRRWNLANPNGRPTLEAVTRKM